MATTQTGVQYHPLMRLGHLLSSADYSGTSTEYNTFVIVNASTDFTFTKASTGEVAIGILNSKPYTGEPGEIIVGGTALLKLGDTVTRGNLLKSDSSGYGVPVASNNDWFGAQAFQSGVANDVIEVLIVRGYYGA